MRSPAKIPVIRRSSSSATFKRKLGPARNARSRISSQMRIAFGHAEHSVGVADVAAPWLLITVCKCATPGMMPFGPPLNPAKKCGSMKPVMIRTSASRDGG